MNEDLMDGIPQPQNLQARAPISEGVIEQLEDGSIFRRFEDGTGVIEHPTNSMVPYENGDFYGNIIDELDPEEVRQISSQLAELVENDDNSQRPYRRATSEFIEMLGLALQKSESNDPATVDLYSATPYETLVHAVAVSVPQFVPTDGKIQTKAFVKLLNKSKKLGTDKISS